MGLVALGFEPGEVASIQSNTNREWLFADLGILGAGGVSNGIYPTDAAAQAEYLLADSASVVVFVEDEEQLDKVLEVRERLPRLRKIIVFDMEGLRDFDDAQVMSLEALRALGADYDEKHEGVWEQAPRRAQARRPRDPRLHLGHHRQAQGRDDLAPEHPRHAGRLPGCLPAGTSRTSAWRSCRSATSPSGSAASTTRSTPARC